MSEGRREHESSQSLLDSNTSWKVWKRGRGHTPKMEKQPKMNAWQPGFLRRIPWGGISCLFGVLCCIVVNSAILATSNGAPITSWKYPPSLYLSVAYTLGNILLSAAFSQGLTIYWWRKALKEGTQLGDLHRYWDHGTSPVAAALAGRNFNFISFAALYLAITPINGPLLQRASTTMTDSQRYLSDDVRVNVPAVTSLQEPSGHTSGRAYIVSMLDANFTPIVQDWNKGLDIVVNHTGCASDGICSGTLQAAGLAVSCNSSTADFDLSYTSSDGSVNQQSFDGLDIFQVDFSWSAMTPSNITLDLQFKPEKDCSQGKLEVRNCTIGAATVEYPVTINGNKSTIALDPNSNIHTDRLLELVEYTPETMYGLPSPLGGYAYALSSRLNSATRLSFAGAAGYTVSSDGSLAAQFADLDDVTDYTSGMCYTKFTDPTEYLFERARDLMFRAAIAQGNATTLQEMQQTSEVRTVTVYRSHFEYLAGAVALTFLAMIIVMCTFNGFWLLGRNVTMSPIETAKAFNAPLLAQEHPNAEVTELVRGAGNKPVRYGEVMDSSQAAFDKGSEYGHADTVELRQLPLAIDNPANVQPLGKRRK
ncbi:hypothetical protein CLAFUR0_13216 [Fulvia fulva]|nr:hypothetical protein CLAFUR0_13216 [Fulvia fulva]